MPTLPRITVLAALTFASTVRAQRPAAAEPGASDDPATRRAPAQATATEDEGAMSTADAYSRSGGSLMRASRGVEAPIDPGTPGGQADPRVSAISLYAVPPPQQRVIRPRELITIIIKEQSEFKSEGTSKLDKKASLEATIDDFIKLNFDPAIGTVKPKVTLDGARNFDGKGTAERKDSLSVRLQAMVVDVKPNGTLVLSARRRIRTEDEERIFLVSGTARVADVTTDNTILSTQLYDFDLQQNTKGTVREATRRGWLPRLLDAINPF